MAIAPFDRPGSDFVPLAPAIAIFAIAWKQVAGREGLTRSGANHVFIYEVYDNEAALQAHRATDHFKKYAAATASMIAKREARAMSIVAANAKGK